MTKPISELPAFLQGLFIDVREVLSITAESVKTRMSEEGKTRGPGEKLELDSDRQRRYLGAVGLLNGPYQRKGAYERSFVVDHTTKGATLHAPHPAGAIGGMPSGWQSRITRGRWNNLLQVLFEELGKIPDAISNRFSVRAHE